LIVALGLNMYFSVSMKPETSSVSRKERAVRSRRP
jgi:hypothetical protein